MSIFTYSQSPTGARPQTKPVSPWTRSRAHKYALAGPKRQARLATFTVILGKADVGVEVIVGVEIGVNVGVGVKVAVKVSDGLGVLVQTTALAVGEGVFTGT